MRTVEINCGPGESAAVVFDRVSVVIRSLHRLGYSCKVPCSPFHPGQFTLETLPNRGGWRVTFYPMAGVAVPEFAAA